MKEALRYKNFTTREACAAAIASAGAENLAPKYVITRNDVSRFGGPDFAWMACRV